MHNARATRKNSRNWVALALVTFTATSFAGNSWWEKTRGAEEVTEEAPAEEAAPQASAPAPAPVPIAAEVKAEPAKEEVPSLDVNSKSKKRAKNKKKKSRRIASTSSIEMESGYRRQADITLNVAAVGGVSATAMTAGGTSAAVGSLTQAGVNADLNYNYFGVELDGMYNFGGSAEASSMSTMNALANVKAQLPIRLGSVLIKPKAGVGFGLLTMNQSSTSATGKSVADGSMSGLYVTAGLDVVPFSWLHISMDYTTSISTSSSLATTLTPTSGSATTNDYTLEGSSFNRVRVGVNVYVYDHFYIGSQVAMRTEVWNFTSPISQGHVQALGVIGYQF